MESFTEKSLNQRETANSEITAAQNNDMDEIMKEFYSEQDIAHLSRQEKTDLVKEKLRDQYATLAAIADDVSSYLETDSENISHATISAKVLTHERLQKLLTERQLNYIAESAIAVNQVMQQASANPKRWLTDLFNLSENTLRHTIGLEKQNGYAINILIKSRDDFEIIASLIFPKNDPRIRWASAISLGPNNTYIFDKYPQLAGLVNIIDDSYSNQPNVAGDTVHEGRHKANRLLFTEYYADRLTPRIIQNIEHIAQQEGTKLDITAIKKDSFASWDSISDQSLKEKMLPLIETLLHHIEIIHAKEEIIAHLHDGVEPKGVEWELTNDEDNYAVYDYFRYLKKDSREDIRELGERLWHRHCDDVKRLIQRAASVTRADGTIDFNLLAVAPYYHWKWLTTKNENGGIQ